MKGPEKIHWTNSVVNAIQLASFAKPKKERVAAVVADLRRNSFHHEAGLLESSNPAQAEQRIYTAKSKLSKEKLVQLAAMEAEIKSAQAKDKDIDRKRRRGSSF